LANSSSWCLTQSSPEPGVLGYASALLVPEAADLAVLDGKLHEKVSEAVGVAFSLSPPPSARIRVYDDSVRLAGREP
jgi:hypothetical protein